jgi:hypothetical protein
MSAQHATPRWISHASEWQAELLRNPHLTLGQKLTAIALSTRLTTHEDTWVNVREIAQETGQSVADVRTHLEAFDPRLVEIGV